MQLEKWYGFRRVFYNLNLQLNAGIHFIHGKNGCGKSTLLTILAGSDEDFKGFELNQLESGFF